MPAPELDPDETVVTPTGPKPLRNCTPADLRYAADALHNKSVDLAEQAMRMVRQAALRRARGKNWE